MYCKKCGQKLNDGAAFCGNCGTPVAAQSRPDMISAHGNAVSTNESMENCKGKKAGRFILPVIAVIVLVGIGIGGTLIYNNIKNKENEIEKSEQQPEQVEDLAESPMEEALEDSPQGEGQEIESIQDTENAETDADKEEGTDVYTLFNIVQGTEENYASATNPNDYQYYNSGIANFRFFYPAGLYGEVDYNEQETESAYGTNLKSVAFSGSAGSELIFTLSRYEGGFIENKTEELYNLEKNGILDAADIVHSTYEDHGRFIITGYTQDRSKLIYDLFNVDSEYVMQMKLIFPAYQGVEDKFQKDYMTECLYRLCGFSGSTANCRSYDTYKSETFDIDAEISRIKEWYYSAQEQLENGSMTVSDTDKASVYREDGNIRKIVVSGGVNGMDYTREYSFKDGRLYFAFMYNGNKEQRFYFVNDILVRYINEQSETFDLEDADLYAEFVKELRNEAYQFLVENM